jgi:hypothetical protein
MNWLPFAVCLPLAACASQGALRQVSLVGQCAADDQACSRRHPVAPIAIGARFHPEVSSDAAGSTTPNLVLDSAAPDIIEVDDGALVAKRAGTSAVLITTDDGSVVDFVHVWAAPVTKITLGRRDGDRIGGSIGLAVGEDVTLQPALWNGAQRLSGEGQVVWEATEGDEGAVSILRDGSTDRRRLRARAPGKATITVALGEAKTTVEIEVVP